MSQNKGLIGNLLKFLFLALVWIFSSQALASADKSLEKILGTYRKHSGVKISLHKKVKSILGKELKSEGLITYSADKFFWETKEPEKSYVIFDGKSLWNVQFPPKNFAAPVQVAKTAMKNKTPSVFNFLLGKRSLNPHFKVTMSGDAENRVYSLTDVSAGLGLKNIKIYADETKSRMTSLSYMDELENEIEIEFKSIQSLSNLNPKFFDYVPPKDASLTEY